MTEAEWRATGDPKALLAAVPGRASPRKLRLLVCACCRRAWDLLTDERSRRAVGVAEALADGAAGPDELAAAKTGAAAAYRLARRRTGPRAHRHSLAAPLAAQAVAGRAAFDPYETELLRGAQDRKEKVERTARAHLVREVFGNPFRPPAFSPAWRTDTAVAVARQMYEARDFSAMPILADALQDAGCDRAEVLDHCRGPGPHAHGCWVVDLVLGKE